MRPLSFAKALWRGALFLLVAAPAKGDFKYDVDMSVHSTLVKNSSPTNCVAVLITANACAVAASCLDLLSDGSLDKDSVYEVYVSDNDDFSATSFHVNKVTVHPKYNPSNHVNDIAVLEYSGMPQFNKSYVQGAYSMDSWDELAFAQRYLEDVSNMGWGKLAFSTFNWTVSNTCLKYSEMYKANQDYVICSDRTLVTDWSPSTLGCTLPVGASYGTSKGTTVITGLYSYAVLDGSDDICSAKSYRVYYTALYIHLGFFEDVLGKSIATIGARSTHTMVDQDFSDVSSGDRTFIGQAFMRDLGFEAESSSPSTSSTKTSDTLEPSDDSESSDVSELPAVKDSDAKGLSQEAVIAIAVSVPTITLLLIAIGLWYFSKRRSCPGTAASPATSSDYLDMLVLEQRNEAPPIVVAKRGSPDRLSREGSIPGSPYVLVNHQQAFKGDEVEELPMYNDVVAGGSSLLVAGLFSSTTKLNTQGAAEDRKE